MFAHKTSCFSVQVSHVSLQRARRSGQYGLLLLAGSGTPKDFKRFKTIFFKYCRLNFREILEKLVNDLVAVWGRSYRGLMSNNSWDPPSETSVLKSCRRSRWRFSASLKVALTAAAEEEEEEEEEESAPALRRTPFQEFINVNSLL